MPSFAHAQSGGSVINHNSNNNGPFLSGSDDKGDALLQRAVITRGNYKSVSPFMIFALMDQRRYRNQPLRILSRQVKALLAAIKSLEDSIATDYKERASSDPGATTSTPDDPSEVVSLKDQLDTLAEHFATLFAKDRGQINAICSSITKNTDESPSTESSLPQSSTQSMAQTEPTVLSEELNARRLQFESMVAEFRGGKKSRHIQIWEII